MSTQQNQEGSLLESLLEDVSHDSSDTEQLDETKLGLTALLGEIVKHQDDAEKVDRSLIDKFIAEIDEKLSKQVDEVIHDEKFQKLESAWRGLHFTVNRTDFRENTRIEMMNLSNG